MMYFYCCSMQSPDEYAWTISVDNAMCGDPLGLAERKQNNG